MDATTLEILRRDITGFQKAARFSGNDQTRVTSLAFRDGWESAFDSIIAHLVGKHPTIPEPVCNSKCWGCQNDDPECPVHGDKS